MKINPGNARGLLVPQGDRPFSFVVYSSEIRDFGKDPAYLREVKTGPFYAIKSVASSLGTLGGIKANERFEVVTQDETPIRGLYAAGNDVGGMYGDSYDLLMAGSTVGFAVNSARIAVESADAYIKETK